MILKLKRTPGIYLTGFMASGKTTIGRALADELGWMFVDLDEDIEKRAGMPVSEIFDRCGEAAFRELESKLLRERVKQIEYGRPHVIALGGGTFLSDDNFELISNNGITLWLDCEYPRICERLAGQSHRPLARDPEKMKQLFETRREFYSRADYRIDVEDDPAAAVARILGLPLFKP
jgi:shikimate kinase